MTSKSGKRVTIYDIAESLGMSASYVSRALNDHPTVSEKIRQVVKEQARQLNYTHNTYAANLRQGSSRTVGVIVPQINQRFFSEAIAGIEEVCSENNHSLVICQSRDSFEQEARAIETLIRQNVSCIIISISRETQDPQYLQEIQRCGIPLIQFDRVLQDLDSFLVVNNNREVSYLGVKHLAEQGYKKISFMGGPEHLLIYKNRREGYIKGMEEEGLKIQKNLMVEGAFTKEKAYEAALRLLCMKNRPDAFFAVSDMQSFGILQAARDLNIQVPDQLGILGFSNEVFTEMLHPTLSSIDQKSKELGKTAANIYFNEVLHKKKNDPPMKKKIIQSELIIRESSSRDVAVSSDLLYS